MVVLCALSFNSFAQLRGTDTCGVWFQTNVFNSGILNTFGSAKQNFLGCIPIAEWADIRDGLSSPYKWYAYDSVISQLADSGYFIQLQLNTGQGTPDSILNLVGKYVTTGHADTGPYPYYYNPLYKTHVFNMLDDYIRHIASLPPGVLEKILALFFGYGSTGDLGPNKGNPADYSYDNDGDGDLETTISDSDPEWLAWQREFMDTVKAKMDRYLPNIKQAANPGNNEEKYSYYRYHFPGIYGKSGDDSHGKSYRGERNSKEKDLVWAAKSGDYSKYYVKGEMQAGAVLHPEAPHKETFSQFVFMANMRLTFPCWTGAMFNVLEAGEAQSPRLYVDWFNEHVGSRNEGRRAFSYPHNIPDYMDTIKFPAATFGQLIDPLKQDDHSKQIKSILQRPVSIEQKTVSILKKIDDNSNPERKALIQALYPSLQFDEETDYYNDGIFNGLENYELGMSMQDTDETTEILARVGPDTSFHGRWAYRLKIVGGIGVVKYNVEEKIKNTRRKDSVLIKIWYLDESNYTWLARMPFCKGNPFLQVTNTGTNEWKCATVVVKNFNFRPNGHDFQIKSASPLKFELVEFENLSK